MKIGTHVDSGQMYRVYWNQAAAAYSFLYFFIFFLSNFLNPESGCCCLIISPFIFYFSSIQTLKIFFTLFSGTVRPIRLKLGAHVDNG